MSRLEAWEEMGPQMKTIWVLLEPSGYGGESYKPPKRAFKTEEQANAALRLMHDLSGFRVSWKVAAIPVEEVSFEKAA